MKNATRYCAGPAYYRMCSTDVYCSKQTGSSSTKGNHHHHFSFLELGRRKLSMQPKFVAAQKMLLKQKPSKHSGDVWFYYLGIYTPLEACIAHINCMSCPSIWATLSALLINILLGSFQLFLHSDQPLWGWNNPVQRCLPVGRLHYPRRRRWWTLHALTDIKPMCNRRRPAATSSRRASFSALASANSFVYFASSAATSRWRICCQ